MPSIQKHKRYFLDNTTAQQQDTTEYETTETQTQQKQKQSSRATKSLFDLFTEQQPNDSASSPRQNSFFPFQSTSQHDQTDSAEPSASTASPPDGIPSIRNWKVRDDGGISGMIYGSVNAADGDYIETSVVVNGSSENGHVVETSSGSRYYLSPDSPDNPAADILNAFKNFSTDNRRQGTITINKQSIYDGRKLGEKSAMETLEKGPPRSTFSLFDLFGPSRDSASNQRQTPSPPPPPPPDKAPPSGVPRLSSWKVNDDNTITGYVFGSDKIGDGNLITTSAIARGEQKQYEIVATINNSLYFLT